ncbi:MAG: hypothetical protein ACKPKO_36375, partial [Candidatus Fonsibacter sp.]
KYVQRLRKYTNRQLSAASPTDTDESKPEKKKRGRTKNVVGDDVVMSDPTRSPPQRQASHRHPPSLVSVYFQPFAQHLISVGVFL